MENTFVNVSVSDKFWNKYVTWEEEQVKKYGNALITVHLTYFPDKLGVKVTNSISNEELDLGTLENY